LFLALFVTVDVAPVVAIFEPTWTLLVTRLLQEQARQSAGGFMQQVAGIGALITGSAPAAPS